MIQLAFRERESYVLLLLLLLLTPQMRGERGH